MERIKYRYTVEDVARMSGINIRGVRRLVKEGKVVLDEFESVVKFCAGRWLAGEAGQVVEKTQGGGRDVPGT